MIPRFSTLFSLIALSALCVFCQSTPEDSGVTPTPTTPTTPTTPVVYEFVSTPSWADEFDYTGLPDATKWGYDLGAGGWGNNEKQTYTKSLDNARVENGKLIIEARAVSGYSSARLVTKNKGDWTYGKFEIRAKLPKGTGTWPAIWMLPTKQSYGTTYWPDNGELDIMEHVGYDQGVVHGSVHTNLNNWPKNTQLTATTEVKDCSEAFHNYIVEWTPKEIKIFVDNKQFFYMLNKDYAYWEYWPFNQPFHLLLNIAIGGNWGGQKGIDDTIFPQRMEVEYVRVYELKK